MIDQQLFAWASGVAFLLLLFAVGIVILLRGDEPVPREAMLIFRIILALAGAGFAAVLPGFIQIDLVWAKNALRAGGALAAFIVLYFWNPPEQVQRRLARARAPVKRHVPGTRIEPDLPEKNPPQE